MHPDLCNWFLAFARAGALMAVFPVFSMQNVPVQVRIGMATVVAFITVPLLPETGIDPGAFWPLTRLLFIEVSIGLLLGFVCRMVFFCIEFAGAVVATEMGLVLSSNFNPLAGAMTAVPGLILYWLGLMLLLTMDMHHWILAAYQKSYVLAPVGGLHVGEGLVIEMLRRTGDTFRIALQMTAPVMAVSLIVLMIFSLLSRAVPQMNVFAESFPARTLAGLTVFGLTVTLMAQHLQNYFRRLPEDMLRVAQLVGAG